MTETTTCPPHHWDVEATRDEQGSINRLVCRKCGQIKETRPFYGSPYRQKGLTRRMRPEVMS